MRMTIILFSVLVLATGCSTPPDLRGTWRLDIPACKAYYKSVNWPPIEELWWQRLSHSRLEFSGHAMLEKNPMFVDGSATPPLSPLEATKVSFTLNSASNGVYKLTCFSDLHEREMHMTLIVTDNRMEQRYSHEGVTIKYFWKRGEFTPEEQQGAVFTQGAVR